jgi:hypothetical protein
MKLKPPVGGGKSLTVKSTHCLISEFNRFVQTADSFGKEASDSFKTQISVKKSSLSVALRLYYGFILKF